MLIRLLNCRIHPLNELNSVSFSITQGALPSYALIAALCERYEILHPWNLSTKPTFVLSFLSLSRELDKALCYHCSLPNEHSIGNTVSASNLRYPNVTSGFSTVIKYNRNQAVNPEDTYFCAIYFMYDLASVPWAGTTTVYQVDTKYTRKDSTD